jgi:hypothetical protein
LYYGSSNEYALHFEISIFRLLTATAAQPTVSNEFHQSFNQQLSPQEKTFLSLLLTNSSHAKDIMARKTAHVIANDPASFKPGKLSNQSLPAQRLS